MSDVAKSGESEEHIEKAVLNWAGRCEYVVLESDCRRLEKVIDQLTREETRKARIDEIERIVQWSEDTWTSLEKEGIDDPDYRHCLGDVWDVSDKRLAELKGAGDE